MSRREPAIRVLVVDDQALFASGLGMLIEAQSDMECVGTAVDGLAAIAAVEALHPDIVLMDLRMPKLNGLDATHAVLARGQADDPPKVIVLTTLKRDDVVAQALAAGASAFLTKEATPDQVLGTIRLAHSGSAIPDLSETLGLIAAMSPGEAPPRKQETLDALSPREREVFLLVARGLTNSEIAEAAYVSEATVKTHMGSILRKLGLRSRVQRVGFAHQNRLVG